jgi:hypothetical protein
VHGCCARVRRCPGAQVLCTGAKVHGAGARARGAGCTGARVPRCGAPPPHEITSPEERLRCERAGSARGEARLPYARTRAPCPNARLTMCSDAPLHQRLCTSGAVTHAPAPGHPRARDPCTSTRAPSHPHQCTRTVHLRPRAQHLCTRAPLHPCTTRLDFQARIHYPFRLPWLGCGRKGSPCRRLSPLPARWSGGGT